MKKFLTFTASVALSLTLFAGGETASAISETPVSQSYLELLEEQALQSLREEYPNARFIDLTPEEYEQQMMLIDSNITPFASAPALYHLQISSAISTNSVTRENFSTNQLSSVQDHGGTQLHITTTELGYGHIRIAKMNGVKLSSVSSQYIDTNGDNIVDGWHYVWNASGHESGTFTYQNTSTNYPGNTMTDSIYIK